MVCPVCKRPFQPGQFPIVMTSICRTEIGEKSGRLIAVPLDPDLKDHVHPECIGIYLLDRNWNRTYFEQYEEETLEEREEAVREKVREEEMELLYTTVWERVSEEADTAGLCLPCRKRVEDVCEEVFGEPAEC